MGIVNQSARRLAVAVGIIAAVPFITLKPAQAIDAGAAVGIYNPYHYPYGYAYPAPAYYPPAPYYPPRSCWDPYYRRYYTC